MPYSVVIGLEVHVQLSTRTKLFCGCQVVTGDEPNVHTCPVCLGLPGTLPVPNARAVDDALRLGLATGCTIDRGAMFTRKNYFYPDLPKGYQITQQGGIPLYDRPICTHGHLRILGDGIDKEITIIRIHLEEDAGKLVHDRGVETRFDANRCGTPLCEIVSGPDMRSTQEAVLYLQKLKQIIEYLGVSDANMEEGNLRCDVNVSLRTSEDAPLGTRVEIKNMNSFSNLEKALQFEIARQAEVLDGGGSVAQETRAFDTVRGVTRVLRTKEDAHDYRYFPEPDLVPLSISEEKLKAVLLAMPELPEARVRRFHEELGLPAYDARVLCIEKEWADWYEEVLAAGAAPKAASNWTMGDVLRLVKETGRPIRSLPVTPAHLAAMLRLMDDGTISGKIAKDVFSVMTQTGQMPDQIVEERGLRQIVDRGAVEDAVRAVIAAHPAELSDYQAGKTKLFGFFVGQVMRATGGKSNPALCNEVLHEVLTSMNAS